MKSSIRSTFLIIQALVALLLVFLVIQGILVWHVCRQGAQATQGLEQEGIPSLTHVATLKQNLNLYRLHSYELMFVQEKERAAKASQAAALHRQNLELLAKLKTLFPTGQGQQLVGAVDSKLTSYATAMDQLRAKIDTDFPAAMQMLDEDIPARVTQLNDAVTKLADHCNALATGRIGQTVGSFDSIKTTALGFGTANIVFAAVVVALVAFNSSRIRRRLAELVRQLAEGSENVNLSGRSVSSASQSLAEGSSKQAASIEETSASLEEMASMTRNNADSAQRANDLARQTREAADRGATDMQAMASAMNEIKSSSDDVAKIIKTIDEIAFQTNILALNAAVEAARAGEAGMGFAVVADEVRNLAQRSAQAAKDTAAKIEGAIAKTAQGVQINAKVAAALDDILTKARQVDELVAGIATASKEQSQGISQVNAAVGQMDKVTQQNAANAEESAAAAQELNAQADLLKRAVGELLQLVGGAAHATEIRQERSHSLPQPSHPKTPQAHASPFTNGNGHARSLKPASPALTTSGRRSEIPPEDDFKDF
jgi:methyl-accepting chemotaxis protein